MSAQLSTTLYYVFKSETWENPDSAISKWALKFTEQALHGYYLFGCLTHSDHQHDHLSDFTVTNPGNLKVPVWILIYILFCDIYTLYHLVLEGPSRTLIRDSTGFFWCLKMWFEYYYMDRIMPEHEKVTCYFLLLSMINVSLILFKFPDIDHEEVYNYSRHQVLKSFNDMQKVHPIIGLPVGPVVGPIFGVTHFNGIKE